MDKALLTEMEFYHYSSFPHTKKKLFNYQFEKAIANKSIQLIKLLNVQSKNQSSLLKMTVKLQAIWKIILILLLLLLLIHIANVDF